MVKWRSHHPRNEPAPTRDVASVERFVIQTANHSGSIILANQPIEVEHDAGMARAPCPHGGFAESTGRFVNSATECMLPHFSTLIEHWPSAFEHHRICAERVRAWPSATLHQPSMTDLSLYNARDNRGAAARTEVGLARGICRAGFTTSVHPIVIRRTTKEHS